jgi:hypothetical protein
LRNRIERFFNRAKNSRRVATRYDKLIESFAAFVLLASIRIWIKFVHTRLASDGTCGRYGETCGRSCDAAGLQSTSVPGLARSGERQGGAVARSSTIRRGAVSRCALSLI